MIRTIFILFVIFSVQKIKGQLRDTSLTYIPIEAVGKKFVISKYENITPVELNAIINSKTTDQTISSKIVDNCNAYNLIVFRKLNILISEIVTKYPRINVQMMHERDISENLDSSIRYIIKPSTSRNELVTLTAFNEISDKFYIYDRFTNTAYSSFPDLESLLKSIKVVNTYYEGTPIDKINPIYFKKYVFAQFPKEKKEMPRAVKWVFGTMCYGVFQWAIIKLANLE